MGYDSDGGHLTVSICIPRAKIIKRVPIVSGLRRVQKNKYYNAGRRGRPKAQEYQLILKQTSIGTFLTSLPSLSIK